LTIRNSEPTLAGSRLSPLGFPHESLQPRTAARNRYASDPCTLRVHLRSLTHLRLSATVRQGRASADECVVDKTTVCRIFSCQRSLRGKYRPADFFRWPRGAFPRTPCGVGSWLWPLGFRPVTDAESF